MINELLAKVEVEIRYVLEPVITKALFRELYQDLEGAEPPRRLNLLAWFFRNYTFNPEDSSWSPRRKWH